MRDSTKKQDIGGTVIHTFADRLVARTVRYLTACAMALLVVVVLLAAPRPGLSQNHNMFEVKKLKVEIKNRFHLTVRDLKTIEPIIDNENRKFMKIYARFSGDEPEYSIRVWRQLVDDRLGFEKGM